MHTDIRKYFYAFAAGAGALTAGLWGGPILAAGTPKTGGIMAPGPDIEAAVKAEYDGVVREGTLEAYERFIRRHAEHPLAEKAREKVRGGGLK